jgi:YVTN family beta-propeller protein
MFGSNRRVLAVIGALVLAMLFGSTGMPASAATASCGSLPSGVTTWTASSSPVEICAGGVTVPGSSTLVIDASSGPVEIKGIGELLVYGTLFTTNTSVTRGVSFAGNPASPMAWPGIRLGFDFPGSFSRGTARLTDTTIAYADVAIRAFSGSTGSGAFPGGVVLQRVHIHDVTSALISQGATTVVIGDSVIESTTGDGLVLESAQVFNTILTQAGSSVGNYAIRHDTVVGGVVMDCMSVHDNAGGLYLGSSGPLTIRESDLFGNTAAGGYDYENHSFATAPMNWWGQAGGPVAGQMFNPLSADTSNPAASRSPAATLTITGSNATASGEIGKGILFVTIVFNRSMNTSVSPIVTLDPGAHTVLGSWQGDRRTWLAQYTLNETTAAPGANNLNVSGARGCVPDATSNLMSPAARAITLNFSVPTVTTQPATQVTAIHANLNGTINPNGWSTDFFARYGTASGSYTSTTESQFAGTGTVPVPFTRSVGLTPGTTYYFQGGGRNGNGEAFGDELSFTTPALTPANGSFAVGAGAGAVAINPATNRLYTANASANTVSVVNLSTRLLIATISTGADPGAIAVHPLTNTIYVGNRGSRTISVIDGATNTVTKTISVFGTPSHLALSTATNHLYTPYEIVETISNERVGSTGFFGFGKGVAVNGDGSVLYIVSPGTISIALLSGDTSFVTMNESLPPGTFNVSDVAFDPRHSRVYVADNWLNRLHAYDVLGPRSLFPLFTRELGQTTDRIAIDETTQRVYVAHPTAHAVSIVDAVSGFVIDTLAAPGPSGVTVDTARGVIYATNPASATVSIYGATDTTAPVTSASLAQAPNAAGWNNTNVQVTLSATDESGVAHISYSATGANPIAATQIEGAGATIVFTNEGATTLTYGSTDTAGNVETPQTLLLRIDKTGPTVTFSGNAGTYTVDQMILITCTASDPLSNISSTSCPAVVSGPATNFVGTTATTSTTVAATATDRAGNSTVETTTFTVTVTADGICRLTASLATGEDICTQVTSIANAPNASARAGKLKALDSFLAVQSGKSIPADLATLLSRLAHLL